MSQKRFIVMAVIGMLAGLIIGLLTSWGIAPVEYVDTTPSTLRMDFKDEYRLLIASAFAANQDSVRARARMNTLQDPDVIAALGAQAQRMMSDNASSDEIQYLANLSEALQKPVVIEPTATQTVVLTDTATPTNVPSDTPTVTPYSTASPTPTSSQAPTQASPTSTITPTATLEPTSTSTPKPIATLAPRPTQTITPTPAQPFVLSKKSTFCDPSQPGLLQIYLTGSSGKPAAGVELDITWLGGDESFFTGLKPELGYGYADFNMSANTEYALSISNGGTRVTNLTTSNCTDSQGSTYPGGIHLEFKQP